MNKKVLIIAEAGVNHNGSFDNAKELIIRAKEAGADIIKFQTFKSENLVSACAPKAEYQMQSTDKYESQLDMLKKLELSEQNFIDLRKFCEDIGIEFLSTAFDVESVCFLKTLNMKLWKIPSGEITNLPYLIEIAKSKKEIILSTGMSTIHEISEAVNLLKNYGAKKISLMHCNTEYPTPMVDVNLKSMHTLYEKFECPIGYSDHTQGIEVAIAAVALGATIIEKHFTLDKNMEGPDHKASLNPIELKNMVSSIRNIELALGNSEKSPTISEQKNINIARKSIIAKYDIKKGTMLTSDNLTTKRPGTGISPMMWNEVIGTVAVKDFMKDELIKL